MKIKVTTITADVPTINGRIYSTELLNSVIDKFKKDKKVFYIYPDTERTIDGIRFIKDMVGVVSDINLVDGQLELEYRMFSDMFKDLMASGLFVIVPTFTGIIESNNVVRGPLILLDFSIIPKG